MDLLKIINDELAKLHLTEFEKVRYIYLRTCELFSFDARYNFTELFQDNEFYQHLINRRIDITNLNDFLVVCHSYSRDILLRLIREFTSVEVELMGELHRFVSYKTSSGQLWFLDATNGDLARVKMKLDTRGFTGETGYDKEILSETDAIIGYKQKNKLEYLKQVDISTTTSIFNSISRILQNSKCKTEFSDAFFLVEYLLLGINFYEFAHSCYVGENYSFHQIFNPICSDDYFCLKNTNGYYELNPIEKEDCLQLTRSLKTKQDILR